MAKAKSRAARGNRKVSRTSKSKKSKSRTGNPKTPKRRGGKKRAKRARYFTFRSRRARRARITERQSSVVLTLRATRGHKQEIISGREVIPLLQKIRKQMRYPPYTIEFVSAYLSYLMPSGTTKVRTVQWAGEDARTNNVMLASEIDKFIAEGSSATKTAEKVFLDGATVKRVLVND